MKSGLRNYFVLLILLFGLLSSGISSFSPPVINNEIPSLHCVIIPGLDAPNITWTSRTQLGPQLLENGSAAVGDHVVLNATFHQELNVTRCEMRVWSGFTYTTTRPLVVPTDPGGVFDGIIDPAQFDWVVIKGIEKDLPVSISCNFTNNDCDFMAWDGTLDQSEFAHANNLLDMASADKPEHDSFIWSSDNDTLFLGCLNYEGTEIGNWTLNFQVGIDAIVSVNASSIEMNTYYITGRNQTCTVSATGYTDLNESIMLIREQVRICNFFAPNVTIYPIETLPSDSRTYNITWSSTDRNADEVNYYSVWLSSNEGTSFMLIASNLTRTWQLWNSSGWLEDDYIFRVRAYSIDLTVSGMADLSDPPAGYWPGDYGDGLSFSISTCGPSRPLTDVGVNQPSDIMYEQGATGNCIVWRFINYSYSYYYPAVLTYEIYRNSELLTRSRIYFQYEGPALSVNIDGLQDGVHNYTLYYENPGASGGYVQDVVFVIVNKPLFNTTTNTTSANPFVPILLQTFLVISIPGAALIALIVLVNKGFDRDIIKRMYN
ncbi:MAG: hypothetical protein KAU48_07725 [Candidatus Thorarchaeota archaeon]|nr:hypothetical protein [Candidatus Thorarchaeota archaeon]